MTFPLGEEFMLVQAYVTRTQAPHCFCGACIPLLRRVGTRTPVSVHMCVMRIRGRCQINGWATRSRGLVPCSKFYRSQMWKNKAILKAERHLESHRSASCSAVMLDIVLGGIARHLVLGVYMDVFLFVMLFMSWDA